MEEESMIKGITYFSVLFKKKFYWRIVDEGNVI